MERVQRMGVMLGDGSIVHGTTVLIATGLKPRSLKDQEKEIYTSTFPNAQIYTYEDAPVDCEAYSSKHVFVFGNGNAATEMSTFIIEECAAMRTWVLGRRPVQPSHMTHYVGNVRTHNLVALESYQLKSLDTVIELESDYTNITLEEHLSKLEDGIGWQRTESENVVVIFANGFMASDIALKVSVSGSVTYEEVLTSNFVDSFIAGLAFPLQKPLPEPVCV